MLLGAEGVGDGEEFALRQGGEEEAQDLQENLGRHSTLLHQLRCKHEILREKRAVRRNNLSPTCVHRQREVKMSFNQQMCFVISDLVTVRMESFEHHLFL